MTDTISNNDDVIDSRDVIERIEELESMLEDLAETTSLDTEKSESANGSIDLNSEREELEALKSLAEEGEQYASDWKHGETLIRDSHFQDYAEELASDIGAIDKNAGWPLGHIDWEAAADSLKQDYTAIKFGGVTYWVR